MNSEDKGVHVAFKRLARKSDSSHNCLRCVALAMAALFFSVQLLAQVSSSGVTGIITDQTKAAVPGATVTLLNEATGILYSSVTEANGIYFFRSVPVSVYTLEVEGKGFKKSVLLHVRTEVGKVSTVDVQMALGSLQQTAEVTAAPSVLDTVTGTVGNLVTQKEINNIPLNGRNWVSLNLLTPGAVAYDSLSQRYSNVTEAIAPADFNVNGVKGQDNVFMIDGVSMVESEDEILATIPPLESLDEFRTETSNPTAEYVGGDGALITAVTRGGTNNFHGSMWEYIRNSAFDARNYFDTTTPPLRRNQFGAQAGGPIVKDNTFWFASWETLRQTKANTFVSSYPTAAMRNGDLSSLGATVVDPLTGIPFPGNIIPPDRINPLSTTWLNDFIPLPNTNLPLGEGNTKMVGVTPINYNTFMGRIDQRFGDRNNLFARYFFTLSDADTPSSIPAFFRSQHRDGQNAVAQYTHSFSHNVFLQARVGANVYDEDEPAANVGNRNLIPLLGVQNDPNFASNNAVALASPPSIGVTGLSQFGGTFNGAPREIYNRAFYYDGLLFVTKGSHAMKMGVSFVDNRSDFPEIGGLTGSWSYTGFFSGLGFGDFLLGYPRQLSVSPDLFNPESRRLQSGLWFQDDWRATSKLTLNLGLRFDVDPRFISANNRISNLVLSEPPVAIGFTPFDRPAGWTTALMDSPEYHWSPRFGFAYKLRKNTVIRGGYGIYWEALTADPAVNLSYSPPWVRNIIATLDTSNLPTFNRSLPLESLSTTMATPFGFVATQQNIKDAYLQEWNFTVEHDIRGTLLSAAYVGNLGTHEFHSYNVNLPPPGPGDLIPRQPFTQISVPSGGPVPPGLAPAGPITYQTSGAASNYHSLQLKAQHHFTSHLSFTVSYAWSKAIDTTDNDCTPEGGAVCSAGEQQPLNNKAERAVAFYDVPQSLTFDYIYALPFGPGERFANVGGAAGKIIGGWQVAGTTTLQSGTPFPALNGYDNLNNGGTGYPDLICNPNFGRGRSDAQKVAEFFNTNCFVPPDGGIIGVPNYQYGDAGRNIIRGPGTNFWSVSLMKNIPISERFKGEFHADAFNVFNTPNFSFLSTSNLFAVPAVTFGTPQFGTITNTGLDSREIQLGLKLSF